MQYSDFIIFPSLWAKKTIGFVGDNCKVISNAPLGIFDGKDEKLNNCGDKIEVVTHHWSMNKKKGFDYYKFLGDKIHEGLLNDFKFTYIGRYNQDYTSPGIKYVEPLDSVTLATTLPKYDI